VSIMWKNLNTYLAETFAHVELYRENVHEYQNQAIEFMYKNPFSALFIDLGLGKTIISWTLIDRLIMSEECGRVLIIAPKRVANQTWPNEAKQWSHICCYKPYLIREDTRLVKSVEHGMKAFKKSNPKDYAVKATRENHRLKLNKIHVKDLFNKTKSQIHIISKENVEFLVDVWGSSWPYDTVIIDESSCFKDPSSNRFKALARVRPFMKRMHQLTATPVAEGYLGLFAQIYLLDRGALFGKSFFKFKQHYFDENPYTRRLTIKPWSEADICQKISSMCLTMKAQDYLDISAPISIAEPVYLDDAAKSKYNALLKDFVLDIDQSTTIEAETAAALCQKLLQMASGSIYETRLTEVKPDEFIKDRITHKIHDCKIQALKDLVDQYPDESFLVGYNFNSSLKTLTDSFPKAVQMDAKGEMVNQWNKGKLDMLLVHPQSAGHGLNMQHGGRRLIFFDLPWSLELYQQLIGRLARQGQKQVVYIHHLITKDTIDDDVYSALRNKSQIQDVFFKILKKLRG